MLVTLKLRECKHFQYLINCTETTYFRENDILAILSLDNKSRYEFMQFTLNKTELLPKRKSRAILESIDQQTINMQTGSCTSNEINCYFFRFRLKKTNLLTKSCRYKVALGWANGGGNIYCHKKRRVSGHDRNYLPYDGPPTTAPNKLLFLCM